MTAVIAASMSPAQPRGLAEGSEGGTDLLPGALRRPRRALAIAALVALLIIGPASAGGAEAAPPKVSTAPTVAGQPTEGSRLVAWRGSWSGSGTIRYAYQWFRCDTMGGHCTALRGVTGRSRRLAVNDVGHTLSLAVHASNAGGSTTAYASLVGPIGGRPPLLVAKVQPAVVGGAVPGRTIHVRTGVWTPRPTSFSYQWARCNRQGRLCEPIGGANAEAYAVGAGDLGHMLVAIVQAKSDTTSRAVFSLAKPAAAAASPVTRPHGTRPLSPAPPAPPGDGAGPSSSGGPLVAEVIQEGRQLIGATGSWSGSGTIAYAYQWYRCDATGAHCKSIHGATKPTYTQVAKDVGQTLGLAVRATDQTGTATAYAGLVGPVARADAALASTGLPTISGAATQGQALVASAGAWTQPPGSVAYQWERCNGYGRLCAQIAGAVSATYTAGAADVGHALLAVVRATVGAASQDALSTPTSPIAPASALVPAALPTVSGTAQEGRQLIGATGSWNGSGTIAYAYQWYRCDATGAHCKSIHGATKPTYTQVAKDVGQTLGLAVRATDQAGTATAYAGLVGPVTAASATLVAIAQPAVSGTPAQGQTLEVSSGGWNQAPATSAFQWQRCNANGRVCGPIAGATANTFTVTAADAGHSLQALVATTTNGVTQTALSTRTPAVS
jgi:hypothetical protein